MRVLAEAVFPRLPCRFVSVRMFRVYPLHLVGLVMSTAADLGATRFMKLQSLDYVGPALLWRAFGICWGGRFRRGERMFARRSLACQTLSANQ